MNALLRFNNHFCSRRLKRGVDIDQQIWQRWTRYCGLIIISVRSGWSAVLILTNRFDTDELLWVGIMNKIFCGRLWCCGILKLKMNWSTWNNYLKSNCFHGCWRVCCYVCQNVGYQKYLQYSSKKRQKKNSNLRKNFSYYIKNMTQDRSDTPCSC